MKWRKRKRWLSIVLSILMIITNVSINNSGKADEVEAADYNTIINNACNWAVSICNDNSHGYSGASLADGPEYACTTLVAWAYRHGGINVPIVGNAYSWIGGGQFKNYGFNWISSSNISIPSQLQRGDILVSSKGHVCLYLGNNQVANAGSDRGHPERGDQTGTEIQVQSYYSYSWAGVLRLGNVPPIPIPDDTEYEPTRTLYYKNTYSGGDVRWVQNRLNKVISAGLVVDGVYGPATKNAVKSFQRAFGLAVDGSFGPQSKAKLIEEYNKTIVVNPTSISISASNMELTVGNKKQLSACVSPSNASNKTVNWTSSNGNIATVDGNGNVLGISPGTVNITASTSNGKTSNCTVVVHNPVYVSFVNYDDSELSKVKLEYGGTATAPENPERKGYKFTGWDGVYQNVTADAIVKAQYSKLSYKVDFKETDGTPIVGTQNILYQESAIAPDETALHIPVGYEFTGWSDAFDSIENDMTIYPVYKWKDGELPIVVETDENACTADYDKGIYTVKFNLKNHTTDIKNARVMIYMMTDGGKMVAQGETRTVKVPAATTEEPDEETGEVTITEDGSVTIDDLYVVCKSPADNARILVLDDYESAVPLAEITDIPVVAAGYGEWTFEEKASDAPVETRTVYRSKAVNYTTSTTTSTIDGWTKYNQTSTTTRNNDKRPNGSGSGASAPGVAGAYRVWAERESYNYGGNIEPTYTITISSTGGDTYRSMVRWIQEGLNKCGIGTAVDGVYGSNTRAAVMTFQRSYGLSADGQFGPASRSKMKEVVDSRLIYYYYYETQTTTNTYYFYQEAPEWSEWTSEVIDGDKELNAGTTKTLVEESTQYRYKENVVETTGTTMTPECTLPEEAMNLAGKDAVVIVFKNKVNQIAEDNVEYIGNTTIGIDGSLNISFIPREEISYEGTGDYTIVLGVKGTTNYVKVGTIEAPKPKYIVSFVDMEGNEISSQEIEEGHDAVAPDVPDVEGYTFTGWDAGITNIHDNLTVTAQYKQKECTVTFVDWENQTIDAQSVSYGELLSYPETPEAPEGKEFSGWSIEENTSIIEDVICEAVYETQKLEVTFVDYEGNVVITETIDYGESAMSPAIIPEDEDYDIAVPETINVGVARRKMYFSSWGEDIDLSNITTNLVVGAIYRFDEDVATPTASITSGEYSEDQMISLETETEGATIIYTTDGSDPTDVTNQNIHEYIEPIIINDKTVLKFYAMALGYNDSPVVEEWYAINKTGNVPYHIVEINAINNSFSMEFIEGYKGFVKDNTSLDINSLFNEYETVILSGLYYDEELTDKWENDVEIITEGLKLFAVYDAKPLNLTMVDEEQNVILEETIGYGEAVDSGIVPEKEGYHFAGFESDDDYTFVTKDIVVTVKYIVDSKFANIKFTRSSYSIMEGSTYKLTPKVTYEADGITATGEVITYSSSNPEIATVDDMGIVTALKKGEVTITAKVESSGTTADCTMKITGNPDTSIVLYSNSTYRIADGYLRNIDVEKNTVAEIRKQINADKELLVFKDMDEQVLAEDSKVGTGSFVRLMDGEERIVDALQIVILGDYNGDGSISSMDVSGVARSLLGKETPEQIQLVAVDVNGDGNVNNRDAAMLARYLVGKEKLGSD